MGNNAESTSISLKSVSELLGMSFFIPSYQRGYRWTETQIVQLLNDVWEFASNPPKHEDGEEKPFYCLQPIVVKKCKENENELEVIDGQQRLTTMYLILKTLEPLIESNQKNFAKIYYETRVENETNVGSEKFLKNVEQYDEKQAKENIDFSHIWKAYKIIQNWFKDKANNTQYITPKIILTPALLRDTKVIWYEIKNVDNYDSSIDIFTRLNIGKIPLTNAELIKALFLQKGNFSKEEVSLKQIQIASEWDMIEKTLQDKSFWYFISNPRNSEYDNRIEYIFDMMKGRTKDSECYHTFNEFYKEFFSNQNDRKNNIDDIWSEIKKYFLTFEDWFNDHELFHYIGYLIDCNEDIKTIKEASSNKTKKEFKKYLKSEIRKQIECDDIDSLEYGDTRIKKVLLLFNIQTVLQTQKSEMRFPFHKYKSDSWDIEHVRSQTEKKIKSKADRRMWIKDVLEYFTGSEDEKKAKEEIDNLTAEKKEICNPLINLLLSEKIIEDAVFDESYKKVSDFFKESETLENIGNISNLALLDAETNRSYKNAFFPIKRKRIIENDKNGIFVPICTKNLFLKYYSNKPKEVMYWNKDDAKDYLEAIKTTLKEFLQKEDDQ